VTVPQGFGFKAQLDGAPKPANFETSTPVTAYLGLSEFHFYRPRHTPSIVNGTDTFVVSGAADAVSLKAGDKLMVGVARTDDSSLDHSQVLVVDKTWVSFGLRYVKTKGAITCLDSLFTFFAPALFQAIFRRARKGHPAARRCSLIPHGDELVTFGDEGGRRRVDDAGAAEKTVAVAGTLRGKHRRLVPAPHTTRQRSR
jgi:hypothetical protein